MFFGVVAGIGAFPSTGLAQVPEGAPPADLAAQLPTTADGWSRYLANSPTADTAQISTPTPATPAAVRVPLAARAGEVLSNALSLIGVRYRYGGTSPESGFDCSGLVRWTFMRTWGVVLPHRAIEIADVGTNVRADELKPGDLVFFSTLKKAFSHVGIYLGDGRFVHAPASGGKVRIDNLTEDYWQRHWDGARRVIQGAAEPALGRIGDEKPAKGVKPPR